uniref:Putative secreted protein n=1 Tax=Anopheles darlingi TaxID=43151 RepID=A0A2M4DBT5_ANODA
MRMENGRRVDGRWWWMIVVAPVGTTAATVTLTRTEPHPVTVRSIRSAHQRMILVHHRMMIEGSSATTTRRSTATIQRGVAGS